MSQITQAKHMSPITQEKMARKSGPMQGAPGHMHGRGPEYLYIYIGLNQWQHSGTSQIHSRQVTANATVETAVVDAPSLT